jgi:hypothetical protein
MSDDRTGDDAKTRAEDLVTVVEEQTVHISTAERRTLVEPWPGTSGQLPTRPRLPRID